MTRQVRILRLAQLAALVASIAIAASLSRTSDWEPALLIAAILAFALISDPCPLEFKKVHMSGAFMGVVLAMVIAGPAVGVVAGFLTMALNTLRRGSPLAVALPNLSTHVVFPLVGAVVFAAVGGPELLRDGDVIAIPVIVGVFMLANVLNFVLIAVDVQVVDRRPTVASSLQSVYAEVFPAEFAISVLTALVAFAYAMYGTGALVLLALVGITFQYLIRMAMRAARRKEEVQQRNEQLASLQVGLISTMLKTLSLRDHVTARHSAAVARYSRAMAEELELDEDTVELIHTAALFHDIGKFIFPDSILLADRRLTDEEFDIVKRHPVVGADLISEIDGYGSVAEIVRHHHERIDGRGYPDNLPGPEIPLGSRIIAVADVYDVITARDTYRTPVSVSDAMVELRRSAGTQLDAELVELFIGIVESRGVRFRHATATDFEAELQLDRRVRDYAAPRVAA